MNMAMHLAQDRHSSGVLIGRATDGTYERMQDVHSPELIVLNPVYKEQWLFDKRLRS